MLMVKSHTIICDKSIICFSWVHLIFYANTIEQESLRLWLRSTLIGHQIDFVATPEWNLGPDTAQEPTLAERQHVGLLSHI